MSNKADKTVCLITNWYPTEANSFQGAFFRDQAIVLSKHFNFLVVHYRKINKIMPHKKPIIKKLKNDNNIEEYMVKIFYPYAFFVLDLLYDFYVKYIKKIHTEGIGKYISLSRKQYIERQIKYIYNDSFKNKFDVLYCVDAQSESHLLHIVSKISNKPYAVSEHSPFPKPGNVICDWDHKAIEEASAFFTISNDKIKQVMLQNIKLPKAFYIGNYVDEKMFKPIKNIKKNEKKTFIIVASNSYYKNYMMFINVMNKLCKITNKDFNIIVCGYSADKGYAKKIEQFENTINNALFANKVSLIPEINHSCIPEILNKADAFVLTSIQEGQPVSALEAACCGLPIFSTNCGGVDDYVDDDIGRLYDVNDYNAMANGLKDFLDGKIIFDSDLIRKRIISLYGTKAFQKNMKNAFYYVINNYKN